MASGFRAEGLGVAVLLPLPRSFGETIVLVAARHY